MEASRTEIILKVGKGVDLWDFITTVAGERNKPIVPHSLCMGEWREVYTRLQAWQIF